MVLTETSGASQHEAGPCASTAAVPDWTSSDLDITCQTNRWYDAFVVSTNPSQAVRFFPAAAAAPAVLERKPLTVALEADSGLHGSARGERPKPTKRALKFEECPSPSSGGSGGREGAPCGALELSAGSSRAPPGFVDPSGTPPGPADPPAAVAKAAAPSTSLEAAVQTTRSLASPFSEGAAPSQVPAPEAPGSEQQGDNASQAPRLVLPAPPAPLLPEVPVRPLAECVPGVGIRVAWAAARCAAQLTGYALEVNDGTESLHFDSSTALLTADPVAARPLPADVQLVMLNSLPKGVSLRFSITAISTAGRGSPSPYSEAVAFCNPRLPEVLAKPVLEVIEGLGTQGSAVHAAWAATGSVSDITGYLLKAHMREEVMYFDSCTGAFTADAAAAGPVPADVTSVLLRGVPAGVGLRVEVVALTGFGAGQPSPLSDEVRISPPALPPPPERLAVQVLPTGGVRVSWEPSLCRSLVTGYAVRLHGQAETLFFDSREETLVSDPVAALPLPPDATSAILKGVPANVTFRADVLAISRAGRGDPSLPSPEFLIAAPHAPATPTLGAARGMQLRVSWTPVRHAPRISGYAVAVHDEHKLLYYNPRSGALEEGPPEELDRVPPGAASVVVGGLLPNVRYTAAVAAVNEVGWSLYSAFSKGLELRRPQAPRRIQVKIHSSSSIYVSWEPPPLGAPAVLGFGLALLAKGAGSRGGFVYLDAGSGSLTSSAEGAQPLEADATSAVVEGLSAGVVYSSKVATLNAVGWSCYSELSPAVSIEAPPAPMRPEIRALDHESIAVQWAQVLHAPPVTGYAVALVQDRKLRYYDGLTRTLVDDAASARPLPATSSSVVVRGLRAGAEAWAKVAAESEAGWSAYSPLSEPVLLLTPAAPAAPQVEVEGSASVRVSWVAPAGASATGYAVAVQCCCREPSKGDPVLYWDPQSGELVRDGWSVKPLPPDDMTAVIHGLSSGGGGYRAKVAATNALGWGRYSPFSEVIRIRAPGTPRAPSIRAVGSDSARVSWLPVSAAPPVTGYMIVVQDENTLRYYSGHSEGLVSRARMAAPAPADAMSVVVRGLPAGVAHRAAVAAVSDAGCSSYSPFGDALTLTGEEPCPWPLRLDLAPNVPVPRTLLSSKYHAAASGAPAERRKDFEAAAAERALGSAGREWALDCFRGFLKAGAHASDALAALWVGRSAVDSAPFFAEVNQVLLIDDEQELEAWLPVIRLLASYVARPEHCPAELPLTAWRGSRLTREQAASLCPGEVICPPMFVSASLSRRVAEVFQDVYLVKICAPGLPSGAGVVHKEASDPGEVILPPYTFLQVASVRTHCVIEVQVLCGTEWAHDPGSRARCFPI